MRMAPRKPIEALLGRLVEAVDVSLSATDAAREAVHEILRQGAETGAFFSNSRRRGAPLFELTPQDREFLRAVSIRPGR